MPDVSDHISQNIADIVALQKQQEVDATSVAQRRLEHVNRVVARPAYLLAVLTLDAAWIAATEVALREGLRAPDAPPFAWLQGCLTLVALLTATVVLISQRRQTRLSEERAHLDLQINLLTEQKVTKLIHLVEELRRDLPMVRDRVDPHATALEERTDAAGVLSALRSTALAQERQPGKAAEE